MSKVMKLEDIFMPCKVWVEFMKGKSEYSNGDRYLGGEYIDCLFSNVYLDSDGMSIIDEEWVWSEKVKLNVVVIRAIYTFFRRIEHTKSLSEYLQVRSLKRLIHVVADSIGVKLSNRDFTDFIRIESEFQALVNSTEKRRNAVVLRWILFDRPSYIILRKLRGGGGKVVLRIQRLIARLYG